MPLNDNELGHKYGKPDVERLGIFSEMPYMHGTKYVSPFRQSFEKGLNMMCAGPKLRCGTDAGYFDPFQRLFIGEGKHRIGTRNVKRENLKPFVPAGGPKKHGCPGDYYGTFERNIEAFGTKIKPQPPYQRQLRNCGSRPCKKGGPGFVDICLNPYPEHSKNRYGLKPNYKVYGQNISRAMIIGHHPEPYFDKTPFKDLPNQKPGPVYKRPVEKAVVIIPPGHINPTGPSKWQGGCHAGCFNKFPEHVPEKLFSLPRKTYKSVAFYPQSMSIKSYYTKSIVNENVNFRVNINNYESYKSSFTKHLLTNNNI